MNRTISVIRIAIILILSSLAVFLILGEEQETSLFGFFIQVVLDKATGIALFYCVGRLYRRWSKVDPWLIAYDKICDEVMDNPNPSQL